jgi:hypothetical protein
MQKINLQIKKNKTYETFVFRIYCPHSKKTIKIHLGKKTDKFTDLEALKLLNYIKKNITKYKRIVNDNETCDYKRLIEEYNEINRVEEVSKSDITLMDVADKYFKSIEERIKREFIEVYKDTFDIKTEEDILENQIYKDKIRHSGSGRRSFKKHYVVEEYEYKQEYLVRTGKPKKNLTKVGIKKYWKIAKKPIANITKKEVQDTWVRIQERLDIGQKTKYSLVTILKTIFNYAVEENYIEHSVCNDIGKKAITRNPHNVRQRILKKNEFHELFECLALRNNPNALYGAIIAYSTGCRAKTALSVRKKDFKVDYEDGFHDYYSTIDLINVKLNRFYTLPLPIEIGKYFYYLLKDYEDDEFVIRHNNPKKRINQPQSEIAKDFKECCDMTVNATPIMKKIYSLLDADREKLKNLEENYKISRLNVTRDMIDAKIETIKKNEEYIKKEREKVKVGSKEYLDKNFSFHNIRHMVVSLTSITNPLYAKRILDHQKYGVTQNYIKAEVEEMRNLLTEGLEDYIIKFIKPRTLQLQRKLLTDFQKEKRAYEDNLSLENSFDNLLISRINFESYKNEELHHQIMEMDLSMLEREELLELIFDEFVEEILLDNVQVILDDVYGNDERKYKQIIELLTN